MKVLLAQLNFHRKPIQFLDDGYPLGMAYLHAALAQAGHEVHTRDLSLDGDLALQTLLSAIDEFGPGLVGLQMLTANRMATLRSVEAIHGRFPSVRIVLGGAHAAQFAPQLLQAHPWLLIAHGEAEHSLVMLANALQEGRSLSGVPGLSRAVGGLLLTSPQAPQIDDLDSLPQADHSPFLDQGSWLASMITTRGCPFACSFCAVARRRMRIRSVPAVLCELESIAQNHPSVRVVRFFDDQMFFDTRRTVELCQEIARLRLPLHFTAMARLRPFTAELVGALEEAGFIELSFGLETGSAAVARMMGKGIRPEDARRAITLLKTSSIRAFLFLIVGLQGETEATVSETADFVRELQAIKYMPIDSIGLATVYPGTTLYETMLSHGRMTEEFWFEQSHVPLFTLEHSEAQLHSLHEMLSDRVNPYRLFESAAAIDLQRPFYLPLLDYALSNWDRPDGPRCNRARLGPLIGWLGETQRSIAQSDGSQPLRRVCDLREFLRLQVLASPDRQEAFLDRLGEVARHGLRVRQRADRMAASAVVDPSFHPKEVV